ncbi:hypothetical protein SEA_ARCHERNM_78 [Mycobacterium phage ArcherNM]|uniref:site-specific recombination directionality factor RDF n=1 Tax=Mycobacterium phage ArcherNM TaxID=1815972 RepID=UPI00078CB176|nr:site-specific recombination directionality factor RDF [Mycobacterium phage ArcherNM]AMS01072.1 hypothetical protein SEA_ARCHERNM_78 [Mycobacterium phage ArcherNM]
MRQYLITMVTIAALAAAILALAQPPAAHAGPLCEVRSSAHIAKYGGLAKDSADHIARGELPTCDPNPPQESKPAADKHRDNDDDGKSRFCRKKWFC